MKIFIYTPRMTFRKFQNMVYSKLTNQLFREACLNFFFKQLATSFDIILGIPGRRGSRNEDRHTSFVLPKKAESSRTFQHSLGRDYR